MYTSTALTLLCGKFWLLTFSLAAGTSCYVCDSTTDGRCSDEYTGVSGHEVDCSLNSIDNGACTKEKATVKGIGSPITYVERTCGGSYVANCAQSDRLKINLLGIKTETWTCTCDGNLCNGGSQLTYSAALVFAVIMKFLF
ncbi:hypothetical protein EB796_017351 [Bugula neritina]|uniref:Protein quiver n=1 Tax=Bugula neritina TaxID=10212 RepID=A0A7J7JDR4_BUGNE|nr:hypothetical protein EB796_017351 [Bugula neritina]